MPTSVIDRIRAYAQLYKAAAAARGVAPVDDVPGARMSSFAEDDPAVHESHRRPDHEQVEPQTDEGE